MLKRRAQYDLLVKVNESLSKMPDGPVGAAGHHRAFHESHWSNCGALNVLEVSPRPAPFPINSLRHNQRYWPIQGPVNVSERVRQGAAASDICHQESGIFRHAAAHSTKLLTAFVPSAGPRYVAVILTRVRHVLPFESAVMSCLPVGQAHVVLNNGVYGERLSI